jgi:hypothetical protein
MLHVPGDGPFVLRVGGDSSDHAFFDPSVHRLPRWAFALTVPFVARTARVVREQRLRVILDLNLVTATPQSSACAFPGSSQYPTVDRILSEDATLGMARSVEPPAMLARRAGLPFVLTEFNSITCAVLTA